MLVVTDSRCLEHDTGRRHPERPDRLRAALAGVAEVDPELMESPHAPRRATAAELRLVHSDSMIKRVKTLAGLGGGHLDADTPMGSASYEAALLAAGAVISATEQLADTPANIGSARHHRGAYCLVRPPGHHATPHASMGFCLFNSIAVAAASLAEAGQRVAIVDIDAHHGNGTQDIFYDRDDVFYASIHEYPLYPGTGSLTEVGSGAGEGFTINIPLPARATGDVARLAIYEVLEPALEKFAPDWMLISVGYDGHHSDPLTNLSYSAFDYGDMVSSLMTLAPRTVAVLEGGYDLEAVARSSYAVAGALCDLELWPEPASCGGPGTDVVKAAMQVQRRLAR